MGLRARVLTLRVARQQLCCMGLVVSEAMLLLQVPGESLGLELQSVECINSTASPSSYFRNGPCEFVWW